VQRIDLGFATKIVYSGLACYDCGRTGGPLLVIVKPETVIKWHRQGFKGYWRWKSSQGRVGRPKIIAI